MMVALVHKNYLIFILMVTISIVLSILFHRLKTERIVLFHRNKISTIRTLSLTRTNSSKSLSAALIQNGIYPRRTNLTNTMYDTTNMPYNNVHRGVKKFCQRHYKFSPSFVVFLAFTASSSDTYHLFNYPY